MRRMQEHHVHCQAEEHAAHLIIHANHAVSLAINCLGAAPRRALAPPLTGGPTAAEQVQKCTRPSTRSEPQSVSDMDWRHEDVLHPGLAPQLTLLLRLGSYPLNRSFTRLRVNCSSGTGQPTSGNVRKCLRVECPGVGDLYSTLSKSP
jgi:hypothetical protein